MNSQLIEDCRRDCQALADYLEELVDWASHVAQWRLPRVVEARRRLRVIQSRLDRLFDKEVALGKQTTSASSVNAREIDDIRARAESDRFHLRQRLAALILRLEKADAKFEDWKPVLYELNLLADAIEQHAEWFINCVNLMYPSQSKAIPDNRD